MSPFEKKKIQIETLSEYLTAIRNNLGLSQKDVSLKTGIILKFLVCLENGDFAVLPAEVYVLGFLAKLAKLYAIDPAILVDQYKKEQGINSQLQKEPSILNSKGMNKYVKKLVVTPKIVSFVLGSGFIIFTLVYLFWQVWSINKTPSLQIISPANNATVLGSSVEINGITDPGTLLTINDQNIFVDEKGKFKTQLGLNPGPRDIVIVAKNRFGKNITKTLTVMASVSQPVLVPSVELKITFSAPVELNFSVDGQPAQKMQFESGNSKIIKAVQKITLSTSDGGATFINLNGKNLGPMGKPGEALTDVPFSSTNDGR